MYEIFQGVLAGIFFFLAYVIWDNGDRISKSPFWFFGWSAYLLCIILGIECISASLS